MLKALLWSGKALVALIDAVSRVANALYGAGIFAFGVLVLANGDDDVSLILFGAVLIILPIVWAGMSVRSLRRRAAASLRAPNRSVGS